MRALFLGGINNPGVFVYNDKATLSGIEISSNNISTDSDGIYVATDTDVDLEGNQVKMGDGSTGIGIQVGPTDKTGNSNATLNGNLVTW